MTTGISAYSTTPASNTAVNGINIAEGCNASNVNDAIRQIMADIALAFSNTYKNFAGASLGNTASATKTMRGAAWALTPSGSGTVHITVTGYTTNSLLGNASINGAYGTGAAPTVGAALTGTAFYGTDILSTSANSGASPAVPFTVDFEVTGLTVGTPYWFDLSLGSSSGTSALTWTSVVITEKPR